MPNATDRDGGDSARRRSRTRFPGSSTDDLPSARRSLLPARRAAAVAALAFFSGSDMWAKPSGSHPQTAAPPAGSQQKQSRSQFDGATCNWFGARDRLKQTGIEMDARLALEGFMNFAGGLRDGAATGSSTADLSLAVQTPEALHWPGGELYLDLEDHAGRDPTTALVGDLQVFDKLNSAPYLQLFELWYEQVFFGNALRLKMGKVDCNSEFSVIDNGLVFLNSSSQVSPTAFLLPTAPYPAPSVNVFVSPNEVYYGSFGAYYSNRSVDFGVLAGRPQYVQPSDSGWFLIGETGLRWRHLPPVGKPGNLKFGGWGHTGTFARFDGAQQRGTLGYYAIVDQTLWQPAGESESGHGLRVFGEHGRTEKSINAIDSHWGGGLTWGFDSLFDDIVGLALQYAHTSVEAGLPHSYELAVEAFYRLKVARWALLMPDLQTIVHPGGRYANALVGTLHVRARL
jgi:porin